MYSRSAHDDSHAFASAAQGRARNARPRERHGSYRERAQLWNPANTGLENAREYKYQFVTRRVFQEGRGPLERVFLHMCSVIVALGGRMGNVLRAAAGVA